MERVDGRVDIAVMHRSTVGTRPLPYLQACVASGTGEAPTCRASLGGEPGRDFEELPTACSALVGEHAPELSVSSTGNALPKRFGDTSMGIFGPGDSLVFCNQPTREFVVAVAALIGETFLQFRRQMLSSTTLRLTKSLFSLAQFVGMSNLLASGERQEGVEAGVNAYHTIGNRRNGIGLCVDEQAEIPARGPFDDASTFEPSWREVLRMKPHVADAWNVDTCAIGSLERIRERDARQLVPLPFEPGTLCQLLETALPGHMGRGEHALQRVTRNAEGLAVVGQQIMEALGGVVEAIPCIQFQLANGPIPDAREVPQPVGELAFLLCGQTELELPLDHATPVFGSRCTA